MRYIILATLMIIIIKGSGGQNIGIDSLIIMPSNPTSTDEISVICYSTFHAYPCSSEEFNISIEDTIIHIENYHFLGGYTAICNSVDTVSIGILSEKNYVLYYSVYYDSEIDTSYVLLDIDTIKFTVFSGNFINHKNETKAIKVYPNPAKNTILLKVPSNLQVKNIFLQSIDGRLIKKFCPNNTTLDISDVLKGQYILTVVTNAGLIHKKIIKN